MAQASKIANPFRCQRFSGMYVLAVMVLALLNFAIANPCDLPVRVPQEQVLSEPNPAPAKSYLDSTHRDRKVHHGHGCALDATGTRERLLVPSNLTLTEIERFAKAQAFASLFDIFASLSAAQYRVSKPHVHDGEARHFAFSAQNRSIRSVVILV